MMYNKNPVKKAPAPSAITVRSRKIHKPKAKRLSMLVWFNPFTRHRPAEYKPNSRSAVHGVIHARNCPVEHRFTPRAMNSLSTDFLLSTGSGSNVAHPVALRVVVDLG